MIRGLGIKAAERGLAVWCCGPVLALAIGSVASAQPDRLAAYYGFLPLEIYKLENRISGLLIADLDGDGAGDIAVANNARSRIDLLLTSDGPADEDGSFGYESNRLPSSSRMRIVTVPVNKEVVSLQGGDFDHDGQTDLAFYGTPAELTILYNEGEAQFGRPRRISTGSAVQTGTALAVGDLNRDGRDDLALMASDEIITILQQEDGSLGRPDRLPHTASRPGILKLIDLDGDGGDDLALLSGEDTDPLRVRFSRPEGGLGPEERFSLESPRAIAYAEMDDRPGAEVLAIESQTGRARVLTVVEGPDENETRKGRLIVYPLPPGEARDRALAVGDLNGDGRADVVATDPENAQVFVFLQEEGRGLGNPRSFPSLVGGISVATGDADGDGRAEVFVLSERENQIGLSQLEDDRLTFPTPLPTSGGEPVAQAVADLDNDGRDELLYVARDEIDGKDVDTLRGLRAAETKDQDEAEAAFEPIRWGDVASVPVEDLTSSPERMAILDINRDGRLDVLVFDPYGAPALLLAQADDAPPKRFEGRPGPLAGVDPEGLTQAEVDGEPVILVARGPFARRIALEGSQWRIDRQYNAGRGTAQIQAAAPIDLDGDGDSEIAMLDRTSRSLIELEGAEDSYRPVANLPIGSLSFEGMHLADFDGDGRDDLLLAGRERFGVVVTNDRGLHLESLASYAPQRDDARLADLIAGDINGDGVPDVIMTDTIEHMIEIAAFADKTLQPALAFEVFEQKSFRNLDDLVEPREIALGDVDGDGRTDMALIVHDRVLVYRQDPGEPVANAEEAADDKPGEPAEAEAEVNADAASETEAAETASGNG